MRPIKVGDVYDFYNNDGVFISKRVVTGIDDDNIYNNSENGRIINNSRAIFESFIKKGNFRLSKESRFKSLMEQYAKTKRDSL